jgi:predicted dehydrogenase
MIGFNMRWHRLAQAARDFLRAGGLGRLLSVRSVFASGRQAIRGEWRDSPAQGGHVLFEVGVHHFDLLRYLTGNELQQVSARSPDPRRAEVSCALADGTPAAMRLSTAGASNDATATANAIDIEGERGVLSLSFYPAFGWRGARRHGLGLVPGMLADRLQGGAFPSSYRRQWKGFADACQSGRPFGGATLADGRAALVAALAGLESAEATR